MSPGGAVTALLAQRPHLPTTPVLQEIGTGILAVASSTLIITITESTVAGHSVLLLVKSGAGGRHLTTVTTTHANTWHIDVQEAGADSVAAIARGTLTTPLVTGNTITLTFSQTASLTNFFYARAYETLALTAGAGASAYHASGTSPISVTVASGTPNEFFVAVLSNNAKPTTTATPTAPFVSLFIHTGLTTASRQCYCSTYVRPTAGSQGAEYTWTGSMTDVAMVAFCYKWVP
jgi:hypothetical protein